MKSKLLLPDLEKETVEAMFRNHRKPYIRNRAKAILLRSEGFSVATIAKMFNTRFQTVYEWLRRYKDKGFIGLIILPGRGLKAKMNVLDASQVEVIQAEIKRNPQSLREVAAILSEKFGFEITKSMLKKYLKKTQVLMA
jgi:transposase